MGVQNTLDLVEVEEWLCDQMSKLQIPGHRISPASRLIEDLRFDSLDLTEFFMEIEDTFGVTLPSKPPNAVYKAVFTRQPFRLSDLAEMVYLQQRTGPPDRRHWFVAKPAPVAPSSAPFTQLGGVWNNEVRAARRLFEPLTDTGPVPQYRRQSDGMRCFLLPAATVEIGCDAPQAQADERPKHVVWVDSFLMDAEPVSTTAYCRFLNSVGAVGSEVHADWFLLDPCDHRTEQAVLNLLGREWRPVLGTEWLPMVLVSWYGANAYSLWANGRDWRDYRDEAGSPSGSFLPTEAQWEYAARGAQYRPFPWGEELPSLDLMCHGQHRRGNSYRAETMPMAAVHERLGVSPFGLHHMAGNVWQWCRDWYKDSFYQQMQAREPNPVNRTATDVRAERGGSWVGPVELCRSSSRRGRPPLARGRCLGFRCVSLPQDTR
jgi:sulfatase modifying factor 1